MEKILRPQNIVELREAITSCQMPILCQGSRTSTVIDWDKLTGKSFLDLSRWPKVLEVDTSSHTIRVSGAVSWEDLESTAQSHGLALMSYPTEKSAQVLAGLATGATGERSFGTGTLRSQVLGLKMMDGLGRVHTLSSLKPIEGIDVKRPDALQFPFKGLKNAPFPLLSSEIDPIIGSEGQLGIIFEAEIQLMPGENLSYFAITLANSSCGIKAKVQAHRHTQFLRDIVISCEFLCSRSLELIEEKRLGDEVSVILFELPEDNIAELSKRLESSGHQLFQIQRKDFDRMRLGVPRKVAELNGKRGVSKKGTDIQVQAKDFPYLLELYSEIEQKGIDSVLFGHFGDSHLHFNLLPKNKAEEARAQTLFDRLYQDISHLECSPFAEHGIGLLKQRHIRQYYRLEHIALMADLKNKYDPLWKLFPEGPMSIVQKEEFIEES